MRPRHVILIAISIVAGLLALTGLLVPPGVLASNIASLIASADVKNGPAHAEWNTCRNGTGGAAIDACTKIIQSGSPGDHNIPWAYTARGYRWQTMGELDKAIADLDEAIRLNPDFALAHINRGTAWLAKDEPDKALVDFDTVVRLTPRSAGARFNLGYTWQKKGEFEKAIAEFDEAIRLDPGYTHAYVNRGIDWMWLGQLDKAIADEGLAIRLDPKAPAGYNIRGTALLHSGEFDKALADFDTSLQMNAGQDHVLMDRGLAWFAKSDYAQAQEDFAQAGKLKPAYAYYAIMAEIAGQHVSSPTRLPEAVAHLDMAAWPAPIVRMFLGQTAQTSVLAEAENAPPGQVTGRVCEADFYAAEYAIGQGGTQDAIRLLRLAGSVCPKSYIESFAVPIELKRLGETP
jgi:lipoprotein NlpI